MKYGPLGVLYSRSNLKYVCDYGQQMSTLSAIFYYVAYIFGH